jgi:hypothetical protein
VHPRNQRTAMEGWSNGHVNSATMGIPDPAMDSSVSRIRTSNVGVAREGTFLETAPNAQTRTVILAHRAGFGVTIARVATSLTGMVVAYNGPPVRTDRDLISREDVDAALTRTAPTVLPFGTRVTRVTMDIQQIAMVSANHYCSVKYV